MPEYPTVYLTDDEADFVARVGDEKDESRSGVIREAIDHYREEFQHRFRCASCGKTFRAYREAETCPYCAGNEVSMA